MPTDDRVVLRSSWRIELLGLAPAVVAIGAVSAWGGEVASVVVVAVVFVLMAVLFHYLIHVVLTPRGIELWRYGRTVVPWSQVEAIFIHGSWFTVYRVALLRRDRSARSLPAPRAAFGVGRRELEEARELVEQWWLRYRGDDFRPSAVAAFPRDDLWAPPPA